MDVLLWAVDSAMEAPLLTLLTLLGVLAVGSLLHVIWRPLVYKRELPRDHRWTDYGDLSELPPPYPNSWFGIAHEDDVRPGKVIEVRCMGKTLAIFRGTNGVVSVVDAYCPHLGANLADGEVVGDCLRCPFHGWDFNQDGSVANIPYSETKQPKFVKARTYPSLEINGIIFVYFHSDDTDGKIDIPWTPPVFPYAGRGKGYRFSGRVEHHVNSHLIEHPENAADGAHFGFLHGAFVVKALQWLLAHNWKATYAPCTEPKRSHIADLSVSHTIPVLGKLIFPSTVTRITQVGPGFVCLVVETIFGEVVFFECTTPQSPLHQKIVHTCWSGPFVPPPLAKIMFKIMMIQLERDIAIWTRKAFIRKPPVMKEEGTILQYRRWFNQFYTESSITAEQALRQEAARRACRLDW